MPLNTYNPPVRCLKSFNHPVFAHRADTQSLPDGLNRLMMEGVDLTGGFLEDAMQMCCGLYIEGVVLWLPAGAVVDIATLEMLDECAAGDDINELQTAADGKHRQAGGEQCLREESVEGGAARCHHPCAAMPLLPEPPRRYVV